MLVWFICDVLCAVVCVCVVVVFVCLFECVCMLFVMYCVMLYRLGAVACLVYVCVPLGLKSVLVCFV